jgi:hypothetical protein
MLGFDAELAQAWLMATSAAVTELAGVREHV